MTVTITITDPTATEARALCAYLTALHSTTLPVTEHADGTGFSIGETIYTQSAKGQVTVQAEQVVLRDPRMDFDLIEVPLVTIPDSPDPDAALAGAPDFDSAGMPWNEKIHASSRATVADGTWRKKRGVSDELVAEVEAAMARAGIEQVDSANQAIAEAAGITDALTVEVPEAPVPEPVASGVTEPTPTAPTTTEDAPPPPPAPTANPFLAVMSRIGKSKLDKAKKDELLTAAGALDEKGAPSILVLNKRPELIDGFIALLDSEGV